MILLENMAEKLRKPEEEMATHVTRP